MLALNALHDVIPVTVRVSNPKTREGKTVTVQVRRHAATSEIGLQVAVRQQVGQGWNFCFIPTGF